jgi:hypothetical protein
MKEEQSLVEGEEQAGEDVVPWDRILEIIGKYAERYGSLIERSVKAWGEGTRRTQKHRERVIGYFMLFTLVIAVLFSVLATIGVVGGESLMFLLGTLIGWVLSIITRFLGLGGTFGGG